MLPSRCHQTGSWHVLCHVAGVALLLWAGLAGTSCGRDDHVERQVEILTPFERAWLSRRIESIRLAPDPSFPPFEYFDDDGNYQGIASDYVHRIERILGIRFRIVRKSSWDEVVRAYQVGEVDVVPAMTHTPQRDAFMLFTEPYIEVPSVIVGRLEETRSLTLIDLVDSRVLVLEGYASQQYLRDNFDYLDVRSVPDTATGLREVAEGRADYFVVHQAVFAYVQNQLGLRNLHIVGNTNHLVRLAFASRKDWPELHRILAKALATIGPEERAEIYNRWVFVMPGWFRLDRTFWMGLLGLGALIAASMLLFTAWNRVLRRRVNAKTQELRDVRDHLVDLFNGMPSALIVVDRDGRITRVNTVARELVPADGGATIGQPFWQVFPFLETCRDRFAQAIVDHRLGANGPDATGKLVVGSRTWNVGIFPIRSEGDRGAAIRLDDVTELEIAEQQLRQSQKMETIGTMAGGLAHDFNNYLTAITGILSLMDVKVRGLAEPARSMFGNYLELMNESAGRASQLVQRLLTFARSRDPEVVPVDLNQAMVRAMAMCRNSLDGSIVVELRPWHAPAMVMVDPVQLEQTLLNLVINAGHAMTIMRRPDEPFGGTLKVSVAPAPAGRRLPDPIHSGDADGRWWVLGVSDTGVGMDAATREKVFDPFFSTKPKETGSGLGLTMVYNIVRRHGGFIEVRSRPGEGTLFEVFLPECESMREVPDVVPPRTATRGVGAVGRVLVVDDEPVVLQTVRVLLEECGFDVLTAADDAEALGLFARRFRDIDAVILDVVLPGASGIEVCRRMQAVDPNVRVILASGNLQDPRAEGASLLGVAASIQKPYRMDELCRVVRGVLEPG